MRNSSSESILKWVSATCEIKFSEITILSLRVFSYFLYFSEWGDKLLFCSASWLDCLTLSISSVSSSLSIPCSLVIRYCIRHWYLCWSKSIILSLILIILLSKWLTLKIISGLQHDLEFTEIFCRNFLCKTSSRLGGWILIDNRQVDSQDTDLERKMRI